MPIATNNKFLYNSLHDVDASTIHVDEITERAVRELHIGILNMMPDDVLRATEVQFTRSFISSSLYIVPHFISPEGIPRSKNTQKYMKEAGYETTAQAIDHGMDGFIVTGANIEGTDLLKQNFYGPLKDFVNWAEKSQTEGPTSTIYSCLAFHAYMLIKHGEKREEQPQKVWGVFNHKVSNPNHPLTRGLSDSIDIPHSRWNAIHPYQLERNGMKILIDSREAGVHMATSPDGFRAILTQGHPEYDSHALLKEWQRDIGDKAIKRLNDGNIALPPYPSNYMTPQALDVADKWRNSLLKGEFEINKDGKVTLDSDDWKAILPHLENSWRSHFSVLSDKWVSALREKSHIRRNKPFMEGVNPDDVFELNNNEPT